MRWRYRRILPDATRLRLHARGRARVPAVVRGSHPIPPPSRNAPCAVSQPAAPPVAVNVCTDVSRSCPRPMFMNTVGRGHRTGAAKEWHPSAGDGSLFSARSPLSSRPRPGQPRRFGPASRRGSPPRRGSPCRLPGRVPWLTARGPIPPSRRPAARTPVLAVTVAATPARSAAFLTRAKGWCTVLAITGSARLIAPCGRTSLDFTARSGGSGPDRA